MFMEVVIASGKGGTGKTFISSNLSYYLHKNSSVVSVDTDAEAPDLLLSLGGSVRNLSKYTISESRKARINSSKCIKCYKCYEVCRFQAIVVRNGNPTIVEEYCEGCSACSIVCPTKCIELYVRTTGTISVDLSRTGVPVVTADLEVGGRNTGRLVFLAREEARKLACNRKAKHIVVDAAPGLGCPVISSITGADTVILVVEPTPPSLSGAKRLLKIVENFNIKPYLIVNKYNLSPKYTEKVVRELQIELLGRIPYDYTVVESYTNMRPILDYNPDCEVSKRLTSIFNYIVECVLK
ncbi:MAG TPA: ATPase [Desulfurococcales archaeon]|nr:ATPase [Desulfurococcales archaeon]